MKQVGARRVWTLEEVGRAIARRFEDIPQRWVEADVRGIRRRGDQVYFSLVDGVSIDAQMKAAVFDRLAPAPDEGARVHAFGQVEYGLRRNQVRFRVARMEPAGEGLLLARIAELRARLSREGLLADQRGRRRVPLLPRRIGLVTSRDGEAQRDFLVNATARFPNIDILLAHTPVQGDAAPDAIAGAIGAVGAQDGVDVIVVTRGGGSLEDLMAFNSEVVCRAVARSPVPVVSAVGHERDVTLCDEVADVRVSTPTAAAMAVVPDLAALQTRLEDAEQILSRQLARVARQSEAALEATGARLGRSLGAAGIEAGRRLGECDARSRRAVGAVLAAAGPRLELRERDLERAALALADRAGRRVERAAEILAVLDPGRTVSRGYAIVRAVDGSVVGGVDGAPAGAELHIRLRDGEIGAVSGGAR